MILCPFAKGPEKSCGGYSRNGRRRSSRGPWAARNQPCPRREGLLEFAGVKDRACRCGGAEGLPNKEVLHMSAGRVESGLSARQRWFVGLLFLFFVALSVQYSYKVLDIRSANRSAILRWREQVLDLANGTDIYLRYNY